MTITATAGSATADVYGTLDEAAAYFTARGIAEWTGPDPVLERALRSGAQYLDNQYRLRWVGIRYGETQSRAWPRVQGYRGQSGGATEALRDVDGFDIAYDAVPTQIKEASFEAALLVLSGVDLQPTLERGGNVRSISKGVGPLSKSITYTDGASVLDRFTAIEGLLAGLVKSTPGSTVGVMSVVRA